MANKSAIVMQSLELLEDHCGQLVLLPESNDLSSWEFVTPSDADSDTESLESVEHGFLSWHRRSPPLPVSPPLPESSPLPESPVTEVVEESLPSGDPVPDSNLHGQFLEDLYYENGSGVFEEDNDTDEEEEEEEEDEDDLDDELVPWHLSQKLGRERMRKLGKRASTKMNTARQNRLRFVKPGCVRGKHGLGIKA